MLSQPLVFSWATMRPPAGPSEVLRPVWSGCQSVLKSTRGCRPGNSRPIAVSSSADRSARPPLTISRPSSWASTMTLPPAPVTSATSGVSLTVASGAESAAAACTHAARGSHAAAAAPPMQAPMKCLRVDGIRNESPSRRMIGIPAGGGQKVWDEARKLRRLQAGAQPGRVIGVAALDHAPDGLGVADVLERAGVEQDDVGQLARRQ